MMIWIFAFKLGWFPLGKFLDPLLWRDAPVAANSVFNDMLLTAGAFSVFMFLVILASRKFGGRRWSRALLPAAGVGGLIALLAWAVSGTGYLAVDILKHISAILRLAPLRNRLRRRCAPRYSREPPVCLVAPIYDIDAGALADGPPSRAGLAVVWSGLIAVNIFRGSPLLFVWVGCSPLLFVCDCCSPQRGSDMSAQGNALGTGTQTSRSPERAQQPRTGHATVIVDESRSPLSSV
ncbi:MAG: hypothetical protein IH987_18920 [Planctomycetes bacterium]|nr:hypothetical protein [Planctomycetota bacterium]